MRKHLSLFAALFMVSGCFNSSDTFKGKMYKMVSAPENMEITIGFEADGDRFFGKALNNYFGTYKSEGNEFIFSAVGTTMMAGPEAMMNAEREYFGALPEINAYKLSGKELILKTSDGKELVFEETGPVSAE